MLLQDEEVPFQSLLDMEDAGISVPFAFIRSIRSLDGGVCFDASPATNAVTSPGSPPEPAVVRPLSGDVVLPEAVAIELPDVLWCACSASYAATVSFLIRLARRHIVMRHLATRDLCFMARVSKALRRAVSTPSVWAFRYCVLFGSAPGSDLDAQALRRACRRSELRAARWLDADCNATPLGGAAACVALDVAKVALGERDCVRIYCTSQADDDEDAGRKLGTLRGHSADITCIASTETLLLSGDAGGSLRLWAVDDFKPVRTLRGHAGSITDCLLLRDGPPVSASVDGCVKIWDASAPSAIATLECDTAITSLAVDAAATGCPGLLYAGGGFIECFDVASATRTLTLVDLLDDTAGVLPVSRLSVHGSLLAAGGVSGVVSLWDVRAARLVACLQGSGACGGLQIDDWKLVAAFADDDCVSVHDIRAVAATGRFSTREPLLRLPTDGRVTALRFCGSVLLAAVQGRPCVSWSFDAPTSAEAQSWADSPDADAGRASERRKKKGQRKVRGDRYAKRTTR